jgi:hypothetical protein
MAPDNPLRRLEVVVAWLVLAALLLVCVPLFLCMPLWCDATHYDLCARNLLNGGVHYRDTFDTNLPGIVWLHALVRRLLGWRPEVLRLVDLLFVGGAILLLVRFIDTSGRPAARVWAASWLLAFYFWFPEMCHCQRDFWMLLPAGAALLARRAQTRRLTAEGGRKAALFGWAVLEGALWAATAWIKPFVLLPCLLCWLVSLGLALRHGRASWGRLILDGLGMLTGGLLVGAAGFAWLLGTGAWPYLREILFDWNPEYWSRANETDVRGMRPLYMFVGMWPWSLIVVFAVPLGVVLLVRAFWSRSPSQPIPPAHLNQALVAACALGWLAQALFLQYLHHYVIAPAVLLAIALTAVWGGLPGRSWAGRLAVAGIILFVVTYPVTISQPRQFFIANHPMVQRDRLQLWPRCWTEASSPELRDALSLTGGIGRVDWQDLQKVADFLRERGAKDGEVTCYSTSTHPIYLELDIAPSTRYFQFTTIFETFPRRRKQVEREVQASGHRYLVSDRTALLYEGEDPDNPPGTFPWNLPVLFRAGRYEVREVTKP